MDVIANVPRVLTLHMAEKHDETRAKGVST